MILHIDMDAFFASVEQAINPTLKGRPLIVGSRNNKYHTVVCAASYEAKRLGIDSGMSTKEAFSICPEAEFIPADSAKYLYVSNRIFEMLKAYPCSLGYSSLDEFDLEFEDKRDTINHLAIAQEIKQLIKNTFKITCSIGIAPNWQLAKLGSKIEKPDGLVLINHINYLNILKGLPIQKVCGIGPALTTKLNNLGIVTCEQLLEYPKKLFIDKFGKIGSWLADCLRPEIQQKQDRKDAHSQSLPKSIGHSYTLSIETSNLQKILGWIRLLSEMIAQRLRKLNLEAKTISVWINSSENGGYSCQKTFKSGICQAQDIFMHSRAILGLKNGNKTAIRAIGIGVSGLYIKAEIPLLEKHKIEEILAITMDKINDKYGDWTIYPGMLSLIHNQAKHREVNKGKNR